MGLNSNKFIKQEFVQRESAVPVPSLERWYDFPPETKKEDRICNWTVRGLSGNEFARMMATSVKTENLSAVIEAISSSDAKKEELKSVLGISSDTPMDLAKRLEQLVLGSVSPEVDSRLAIKLASTFPIEFYILTNKITELTGLGMDVKK